MPDPVGDWQITSIRDGNRWISCRVLLHYLITHLIIRLHEVSNLTHWHLYNSFAFNLTCILAVVLSRCLSNFRGTKLYWTEISCIRETLWDLRIRHFFRYEIILMVEGFFWQTLLFFLSNHITTTIEWTWLTVWHRSVARINADLPAMSFYGTILIEISGNMWMFGVIKCRSK